MLRPSGSARRRQSRLLLWMLRPSGSARRRQSRLLRIPPRVAHCRFHRGQRLLHQRRAGLVHLVDGQHDVAGGELARVGIDRLLVRAHLVEQLGGDRAAAAGRDQAGDGRVEVVAAQARDAAGGDHLVALALHVDQRSIEGAAAQIVDEHVLAFAGDRVAEAVRVLEARRARLVEHCLHVESRAPVRVHGDQALRGGGVGGHAHRRLDGVVRAQAGVGVVRDLLAHVGEKSSEQVGERVLAPVQEHLAVQPHVVEQAFERAQDFPSRLDRAESQLAASGRDHRADHVAVLERHDRVVASIDQRDDGMGGAEVDAEAHAASLAIW